MVLDILLVSVKTNPKRLLFRAVIAWSPTQL